LQLGSGPFSVDTLVHAEQFLGLDDEGSITAPAAAVIALTAAQTEDAAKHPTPVGEIQHETQKKPLVRQLLGMCSPPFLGSGDGSKAGRINRKVAK
jgi:hypothetical protein